MNKRQLISRIAEVLKENEIRKSVAPQRTVLHISDDSGSTSDFIVKRKGTDLQYTIEDVSVVIDACLAIIEDALKSGDEISIQSFGTLGLRLRAPRMTSHPVTGERVDIAARYVPKLSSGKILKNAAAIYSMIAEEKIKEADEIIADRSLSDELDGDDDGCD